MQIAARGIAPDNAATLREHSVENQLTFLRHHMPTARMAALSVRSGSIDTSHVSCDS